MSISILNRVIMKAEDIQIGDTLFLKASFHGRGKRTRVTVTDKWAAQAEVGMLFKTSPQIGSGGGISSGWLERGN